MAIKPRSNATFAGRRPSSTAPMAPSLVTTTTSPSRAPDMWGAAERMDTRSPSIGLMRPPARAEDYHERRAPADPPRREGRGLFHPLRRILDDAQIGVLLHVEGRAHEAEI